MSGRIDSIWEQASDNVSYYASIPAGRTVALLLKGDRIKMNGEDIMKDRSVKVLKDGGGNYRIFLKSAGKIPGFLRTLTLVFLPAGIAVSVICSPREFAFD